MPPLPACPPTSLGPFRYVQGLSVPDGALVVDVTALTNTSLSQDGNTFTVGAGKCAEMRTPDRPA